MQVREQYIRNQLYRATVEWKISGINQRTSKTTSIIKGLNLLMYCSSSISILASFETLAICFAISCICLKGPDNSCVNFGISLLFSSQTKQDSIAALWAGLISLKSPLNTISVSSSSSALLNSHAIRPECLDAGRFNLDKLYKF